MDRGRCLCWSDVSLHAARLIQVHRALFARWLLIVLSEALYEDETFPERQLAALVLAKVYYHLQEYNESMAFALGAGDLFQLDNGGEFEETIISKCVDQYIADSAARHALPNAGPPSHILVSSFTPAEDNNQVLTAPTTPFSQSHLPSKSLLSRENTLQEVDGVPVNAGKLGSQNAPGLTDSKTANALEAIIERLFEQCLKEGRYRQVVGVAIEARNLEVLRRVIKRASDDEKVHGNNLNGSPTEELMEYVLNICMDVVQERALRTEILKLILELLREFKKPDFFAIARCIVYLNQFDTASELLKYLVKQEDNTSIATAYQIAFDLHDNGTQDFLRQVSRGLPKLKTDMVSPRKPVQDENAGENKGLLADSEENGEELSEKEDGIYFNLKAILNGTLSIRLNLEFLYSNNHTDVAILNKVRDSLEPRNSIFHTAVTVCNGFLNFGTTNDKFFRDNLEWLGKAVNWSKFSATASLGVIHKGNLHSAKKLLGPYLPNGGVSGSTYSQGGALYAYGLIYANHGAAAREYLRTSFIEATDEVVLHGAALGLGLAGMATHDDDIIEKLRQTLFTDSAINGEAVGTAMGLIMLGSGNVEVLEEMIRYAHDTQHEKIVRGLALGMALIMFGRQEAADELIEGLLNDADPTLRYGGIMTVAMAYAGTGSNKAVRKLLHVAVSDVNDDVRRIAVMSLGFILFRKPSSVPRMVELLSESYNPHVRYGAAMALGISCAGTGLDEAIDLLEPMMKDPTDFVRQGALMALAMIMIQQNDVMNPKVASVRATLKKTLTDRHEDAMTKFGCALAIGILDAGGRNCTISLQTPSGNLNMQAIVGMLVFTQYWYWFPFSHFLSLAFTPTALIALDHDLDMPDLKVHCATKKSLFDYPPKEQTRKEVVAEAVKTAVLSTTAKEERRRRHLKRERGREQTPKADEMDVDDDKTEKEKENKDTDEKEKEKEDVTTAGAEDAATTANGEEKKKKAEKEKVGYELSNVTRVLPAQLKYISFPGARYKPVKKNITGGFVLVHDSDPESEKHLVEQKVRKLEEMAQQAAREGVSMPQPLGGSLQFSPHQPIGRMGRDPVNRMAAGLGLDRGARVPGVPGGAARTPLASRYQHYEERESDESLVDRDTSDVEGTPEDFEYFTEGDDEEEEQL